MSEQKLEVVTRGYVSERGPFQLNENPKVTQPTSEDLITEEGTAAYFEHSALAEKYGEHLGFNDSVYKELGVKISSDETEILSSADIIVQLGLLSDKNLSNLKDNQTLVGVFNPYNNQEKIKELLI